MKNEKLRKLFFALFLIVISIKPGLTLYAFRDSFFSPGYSKHYEALKAEYYSSQYVKKNKPGIIPDEALESFAGGAFLKGLNPILIIHDQPPLGRYIIALSILLFDNQNTVIIFVLSFAVLGVFFIAKLILKRTPFALLPIGIFMNEPLFLNKLKYTPLLEPIQLPFIIFALYFFIKGTISKNYTKWFILTSVMLGFVISIRFFILGLFLTGAMVTYFLLKKQFNRRFLSFTLTLPLSLIVLLVSYTRTIQSGDSIIHVFGIQKYIYYYHKSQLVLPFSFWDLLLLNRWHTWWGIKAILSDNQWNVIWPISTFITLFFLLLSILKRISISKSEKVILIWIICYCLFLSLGGTSTRYFIPLLPFLYIISTDFLLRIMRKIIYFYHQK